MAYNVSQIGLVFRRIDNENLKNRNMSTITKELIHKQKKADWFSGLTDSRRKQLLSKHKIDRTVENGTLLNEDVFLIYDEEHDVCESCENEFEIDTMRMDDEDGNWFCKTCMGEMNQA